MVDRTSLPAAKIALFRSLFRVRDDVYARRFESKRTGKSGYAPACANEWVRGVCEKPRIKCADCPHRRFLPLTDDVIRWHLSGCDLDGEPFVAGGYPLFQDETCAFLAIDFDKAEWGADSVAFLQTCRRMHLPAALERSRSGRGGHVWLFFEEAIPAALARRLGSSLLTETMERRPDVGLDSYDRLFPNQDFLPQGGFGNLIALPLQKVPRDQANSVFVDDNLKPWPDQWAFLAGQQRVGRAQAEGLVQEAERRGRVLGVRLPSDEEDDIAPWTAPPSRRTRDAPIVGELPQTLELVLGNQIYIAKEGLPPALRNRLLRLAAFQNPEFYKAQAMRLSTYGKPRVIACAEDHPHHIGLPRGCLDDVRATLQDLGIRVATRDERHGGQPLRIDFSGELRPEQKSAVQALLAHDMGVLAATTAFGKTVVAAWLIARRGVNVLVLVHRRQLLDQWVERLSAPGFEEVARQVKARYFLGLSATVVRKDGHQPIIFMQCGPVRHRVDAKQQAAKRPFEHFVMVQPTAFRPIREAGADRRVEFQSLYQDLIDDEQRNRRICADVVEAVRAGRSPLVLTERNDHLERLEQMLIPGLPNVVALRAGMGKKQKQAMADRLAAIAPEEPRVMLATGKYVGEGYDDPRLDTLFLTLPVSWRGTIAQYAGRLHRPHDAKREVVIYDYADLHVPVLARMFDRRCRGYEGIGYTIHLPASATPGWPAEVPLPSDPMWKRDYSRSVRRLIRDGVDLPLAGLFVHAARTIPSDAEGIERARSSVEAFLYRRLETLPETKGRFRLNALLPIAFDATASLEVDLLCEEARVAVELDGPQHLADPIAYRRDRSKDRLLQQSGYFVLRFLAEDVSKELDLVLDCILRTVGSRCDSTGYQCR